MRAFVGVAVLAIVAFLAGQAQGQRPLVIQDVQGMVRVSPPTVSKDLAVYGLRKWDPSTKKTSLWLEALRLNTSTTSRLTRNNTLTSTEAAPAFFPDGKTVAFQGDDDNTIYQANVVTGQVSVLATIPVAISTFKVSPNGKFIVFSAKVYIHCNDPQLECTADREQEVASREPNTGYTFTQMYVRHWDAWETEDKYSHIFMLPVAADSANGWGYKAAGQPVDLMYKMSYAGPVPPFGGEEQYSIHPSGTEVAFTAERIAHDTAWKTGWQVFKVAASQGAVPILLSGMAGEARCQNPSYSADGRYIAYLAMDRPGLESDKNHLNVHDRTTGQTTFPALPVDKSIDSFTWAQDSDSILFDTDDNGRHPLFHFRLSTRKLTTIIADGHNMAPAFVPGTSTVLYSHDTLKSPAEIFRVTVANDKASGIKQLTSYNAEALSKLYFSNFEDFYFDNQGTRVHGMLLYPINFDPTKKYPAVQLIHGGPEGAWSDSWSTRWNPQLFASAGYVTFFINPRGSTGYGTPFMDAVRHDWGGMPFKDLMVGNDYVQANFKFVDGKRQCALGASYGGFMINWINGHDDRFKCLVNHDGLFSGMAMYYSSEEVFFNEAEFGPPPYASAEAREAYEKFSPQNYVQNWKTPTLVIHGGKDYRIPITEGLSTFTALQRKGIPSKLLYFPEENHWVLKPDNSIMWYNTVLDWVGQYAGKTPTDASPVPVTPRR